MGTAAWSWGALWGRGHALTEEGHIVESGREASEPLLSVEAPDKAGLWKLSFHRNGWCGCAGGRAGYILNEPQTQLSPHNLATPLNRLRGVEPRLASPSP